MNFWLSVRLNGAVCRGSLHPVMIGAKLETAIVSYHYFHLSTETASKIAKTGRLVREEIHPVRDSIWKSI